MFQGFANIRSTTHIAAVVFAIAALTLPAAAQEATPVPEQETAPAPAAEPAPETAATAPQAVSNSAKIATVYRNGYKVTISGKSQATGTFTIAFKANQEDPVAATVNVVKGMQAKKIAQDLAKELTIAAGSRYKVKQNGTKVTVKKANKKSPALAIQITEQKLTGVALLISGL